MSFDPAALFFLRPHWLWALLALPALAWWWRARRRRASVWRQAVDAHLLPHLLDTAPGRRRRGGLALAGLAYGLAVLALAGPGWREAPQPVWQSRTPLVIALDLSSAMLAPDLPPTRLAQARAKLATLLRERQGGQVALVAFADEPFTVAPLTDDAHNVALFLEDLAPEVMPVDGQRVDRAIEWSVQLLRRTGFERGGILLLTDHADAAARAAATAARRQGYRVSILGLGTPEGANVRMPDGGIGQVRLDAASLRALARVGGGAYATLTADDADLRALGVLDPAAADGTAAEGASGRMRRDEGYLLLPLLMLLALPSFRRRGVAAVLALGLLSPWQARAADWWQRPDQAAHQRMEQAAQAYRKGEFERAATLYGGLDGADAEYNQGNALAKAGRYPEAVAAYDRALRRRPGMPDAVANRRAVLAAMKRQPPQGPRDGQRQQGGKGSSGAQGQQGAPGQQPGRQGQHPGQRASPGQQGQRQGQQGTPGQQAQTGTPPSGRPDGRQPDDVDGSSAQTPGRADARAQQAADAAQRARMQRALQQQRAGREPARNAGTAGRAETETPAQRERRLTNEAWLRRVPDDPGGLLRAKFQLEYERRHGARPPEE